MYQWMNSCPSLCSSLPNRKHLLLHFCVFVLIYIYIYIYGRHDKLAQKKFSLTQSKNCQLDFLYCMKKNDDASVTSDASGADFWFCPKNIYIIPFLLIILTTKRYFLPWYCNKMVLQNTLRSDVSAILKSIHVREIVRTGETMIDW